MYTTLHFGDDLPILLTRANSAVTVPTFVIDEQFPTTVVGNRKADLLHIPERLFQLQTHYQHTDYHDYTAAGGSTYGTVDADSATFAMTSKDAYISSIQVCSIAQTGTPVARFGWYNVTTGVLTALTAWTALTAGINTLTLTSNAVAPGVPWVPMLLVSALTAGDTCQFCATVGVIYTEV